MKTQAVSLERIVKLERVRRDATYTFSRQPATGRYYRIVFDGTDAEGRRVLERKRMLFSGVRAADAYVGDMQASIRNGALVVAREDETLGDWLTFWLTDVLEGVTPKTREGYEGIVNNHLIPSIGGVELARLDKATVREFIREQRDAGKQPRTIVHYWSCLRAALNAADDEDRLPQGVPRVRLPKVEGSAGKALTFERAARLEQAVEGARVEVPVLLALHAGLRGGEVCGLRWCDVDTKEGTVRVERSIEYTKAHGLRVKPPKSKRGRRTVPMSPLLRSTLLRRRKELTAINALLVHGDAPVWPARDGGVCAPATLATAWTVWRAAMKPDPEAEPEFAGVRFHDLRHTAGSLWLASGYPLFQVSRWLGHSTIQLTSDTYGHEVSDADYSDQANKLEASREDARRKAAGAEVVRITGSADR